MKVALIKAFAFGSGFALTIALVGGAALWYLSRPSPPEPWNDKALNAVLSDIEVWQDMPDRTGRPADQGFVEFVYIVENRLDKDYSTDGASIKAMVRRPDGLVSSDDAIKVKYPIFIPSGQKVAVTVSIPYAVALGPIEKDTDMRKTVREKLPKLSGFVLFDQGARYQIELPKDW